MIAQLLNDILLIFWGPKTIISVLFSLSWRKLFDNHFLISAIHSSNGCMESPAFSGRYNCVQGSRLILPTNFLSWSHKHIIWSQIILLFLIQHLINQCMLMNFYHSL